MSERFKDVKWSIGKVLLEHNIRFVRTVDGNVAVRDIDPGLVRIEQFQASLGVFEDWLEESKCD